MAKCHADPRHHISLERPAQTPAPTVAISIRTRARERCAESPAWEPCPKRPAKTPMISEKSGGAGGRVTLIPPVTGGHLAELAAHASISQSRRIRRIIGV